MKHLIDALAFFGLVVVPVGTVIMVWIFVALEIITIL